MGAGAAGMSGCASLRWPIAGLRSVSSPRLRCARTLWTVTGRRLSENPANRLKR